MRIPKDARPGHALTTAMENTMNHRKLITALTLATLLAGAAQAHITLEQKQAPASSTYKAIFRVGHGCAGSPTTGIRVFLPAEFSDAKPMPKPGWKLEIQREALTKPDSSHDKPVTDRVAVISWQGGPLADAEYDEFVLRGTLPAEAGKLYFRVLQTCEKGQNDWSAIQTGQDKPSTPAAVLEVTPANAAPTHSH